MIRIACEENNIEWTGGGWLQCSRYVNCPKVHNKKILGFDCFIYVDNLPSGTNITADIERTGNDNIITNGNKSIEDIAQPAEHTPDILNVPKIEKPIDIKPIEIKPIDIHVRAIDPVPQKKNTPKIEIIPKKDTLNEYKKDIRKVENRVEFTLQGSAT